MKIYISGKISGTSDYIQRFHNAELKLKEKYPDAEIVNPVVLSQELEKKIKHPSWLEYMRNCVPVLYTCSHIYMLPDWLDSKGAKYEHQTAVSMGIIILDSLML